jgi:RNA polymerase sigma factor (sigma-70 family)
VTAEPFEQVVADHGAVVMRVCRAMLRADDAEDAWAETFIAALRAYPSLRPDSNVRGWLVTIAHRKGLDQLRRNARAPVPAADLPERPSRLGNPTEPDTELLDALAALPCKQRAAVTYHYIAGVPYGEIGALLETSAAAARRSAADGIAKLRATYQRGGSS